MIETDHASWVEWVRPIPWSVFPKGQRKNEQYIEKKTLKGVELVEDRTSVGCGRLRLFSMFCGTMVVLGFQMFVFLKVRNAYL